MPKLIIINFNLYQNPTSRTLVKEYQSPPESNFGRVWFEIGIDESARWFVGGCVVTGAINARRTPFLVPHSPHSSSLSTIRLHSTFKVKYFFFQQFE